MMRLRDPILGAVFLATFNCISASAPPRFTVGSASAAPGEKATGPLEVPAGVDAATSIPVVVVNGAKLGKVLALVSGAHGTEYVSIIAIEKLIAALDPAQVTGTVILLPLINIQSFEQKVPPVNPIDNKSMNRSYPCKAGSREATDGALLGNGPLSTMPARKNAPGQPPPMENPLGYEKLAEVLAEGPGLWCRLVKGDGEVAAGMRLAVIPASVGKVIAEP